jgi:hypothetical protein
MSFADSGQPLNDCGCCEGISKETPLEIANRPGLSAIAYRIGAHSQFKETMLAQLSGSRQRALSRLTTRDDEDYSIALLDAWATVGDVLTFYQERIANEAYLRTATERLSVRELARLIDYQLHPGVAAATYLAFAVEDAPGALGQVLSLGTTATIAPERLPPVTIDIGTKVQSIPGPGEQAQSFETVEKIEARPEWNVLKPRLSEPHPIKADVQKLLFDGLATGLNPGDGLLLFPDGGSGPVFRQVASVTLENKQNRTAVQLQDMPKPILPSPTNPFTAIKKSFNPGPVTRRFLSRRIDSDDLHALARIGNFKVKDIFANLAAIRPPPPIVIRFGISAKIFGHNAPKWDALPVIQRIGEYRAKEDADESPDPPLVFERGPYSERQTTWVDPANINGVPQPTPPSLANYPGDPDAEEPEDLGIIYLDNVYPTIVKESWIVLKDGQNACAYQVGDIAEISKSDFTLTAKVTRLKLKTPEGKTPDGLENFTIRNTTVFGQSEESPLAPQPIDEPVSGETIDLNEWVEHLYTNQKIIVCGEKSDDLGVRACELATIDKADDEIEPEGSTGITLRNQLTNSYVRDTVTINANVALATHGETVEEVLGGGDATIPYQTFTLRQPPLTYVSADRPSGGQTTLEIRVNDLLWREVHSFYNRGPEERIYVTRLAEDGKTTVMFGDGTTGARLPTGLENVKAKYRKGIGLGGLVKADQLTQLMTRPLGLKGVTNPLAAAGAGDSERIEEARRNAPLTVLTLDRIVSLRDYEDFARAFAGIEKALATWTWFGEKRGMFVTVAGPEGAKVEDGSELQKNLLKAMRQAGDPRVPLLIRSYQLGLFRVAAAIKIASDFLPDKVLTEVEQKLRDMFSFDSRAFGQPVHLSEVIGAMQNVRGVVAVDVNEFYRSDEPVGLRVRIPAAVPQPGENDMTAAELLILDPGAMRLGVLI